MDLDAVKILEELNSIMEDELVDDFGEVEIENTSLAPEVSLTDELNAKERIARGLDYLKAAIDTFKSATLTEIDLLNDTNITLALESLDQAVENISNALSGKINTVDKNESEPEQVEDSEEVDTESEDAEEEATEEPEEEEEGSEDAEFEEQAEFDLFK